MIIRRFKAENFRNIEKCDISFAPGVNLLHGKNAQGKTNAIEGIYLFSRGKSHRAKDDGELTKFGELGFRIFIEYEDKEGIKTLEYSSFGKEKQRKKNGYKISGVREMIGNFRSVMFYPDNLILVKEGPEERRGFLNVALSQIRGIYIKNYQRYKEALDNRNALIKFINKGMYVDRREIESWSSVMAEYAAYIYVERVNYIEKLDRHSKRIINDLSCGKEDLSLKYKSDIKLDNEDYKNVEKVKEEYLKLLSNNLEKEIAAGITLYGPHRDDMEIYLNGISARSFSSQGQQRSVVLSLKLGEGEVIKEEIGEYPVFLFDDVLSELDEARKKYILEGKFKKNGSKEDDMQIIITSCEDKNIINHAERIIEVAGGEYVPSHR